MTKRSFFVHCEALANTVEGYIAATLTIKITIAPQHLTLTVKVTVIYTMKDNTETK